MASFGNSTRISLNLESCHCAIKLWTINSVNFGFKYVISSLAGVSIYCTDGDFLSWPSSFFPTTMYWIHLHDIVWSDWSSTGQSFKFFTPHWSHWPIKQFLLNHGLSGSFAHNNDCHNSVTPENCNRCDKHWEAGVTVPGGGSQECIGMAHTWEHWQVQVPSSPWTPLPLVRMSFKPFSNSRISWW